MTPELEAKIRAEFEQTVEDWQAHDEWQFADREAAWEFFYLAGRASVLAELEQVAHWNGKETAFFEHETDGHPVGEVNIPIYRLTPELQAEKEKS